MYIIEYFLLSFPRIPQSPLTSLRAQVAAHEGVISPPVQAEICLPSKMSLRDCWGTMGLKKRRAMERNCSGTRWRGKKNIVLHSLCFCFILCYWCILHTCRKNLLWLSFHVMYQRIMLSIAHVNIIILLYKMNS